MSHPIDSLAFRPPRFSEDFAWLPGWLQQPQKEQFDECINELQCTNLELASKDFKHFQQNASERKDVSMLSHEEGRCNSYRLFLSGEENSTAGFASSPGNVLHFRLHLSSTRSSQCSPTQPLEASQKHLESNKVMSVQRNDTAEDSNVKTSCEVSLNVGGIDSLPLSSIGKPIQDPVSQRPSNKKISSIHFGEKLNARYLKAADINNAVELSIGASEALVIHEIVRSGLASEVLPTEVVLEATLWVKKARLEWLEDASDSPDEEPDKSDSLSDLDDFIMADAYEDVGLSQSIPSDECACDSAISEVKETPVFENQQAYVISDSLELRTQHDKLDISSDKELGENLVLDIRSRGDIRPGSVNCDREELYYDPILGSNFCIVAPYDPSDFSNDSVVQQTVAAMVDAASYQPQNGANFCPHDLDSGNAKGVDMTTHLASGRFRSRWLGGWTGQGASASPVLRQNTKSILKCIAIETSFLSESMDIAPDVNSFVQVHETESTRTSDSSIPFAGLHNEALNGILLSQDVVPSCSLSLVDPLCSIVPCSISSENASPTVAQSQADKSNDTDECFRPAPELGQENLCKPSNLNIEFNHEKGQAVPTNNGQHSPVRRKLNSLRTYSTLNHVSVSGRGSIYHSQSFELECELGMIPFNKNMGCTKGSCKEFLRSNHACSFAAGRDNEEKGVTTLNGNSVASMKNLKRNYHGTTGDRNDLTVHASKRRRQPLILNHRAQLCLHASKPEKHPIMPSVPEKVAQLQQNMEIQNMLSECKNSHDRDVSVKKRVRFCEPEIPGQQNENIQKQDLSTKNCSTARASKKRKHSKFESYDRSCLTNCHLRSGTRLLFQGIEFLLTGFSSRKEKDIEGKIWKHGGTVLSDVPSPDSRVKRDLRSHGYRLPIILCLKKLQTAKFLFGCAVNAFILKLDWLSSSISAGCILPPEKYMILLNRADAEHIIIWKPFDHDSNYIFEGVGVMLHGKHSFYSKLAKIIKHGGGKVFKNLQWLVHSLESKKVSSGAIVAEEESKTSRHLRHCASEKNIPILPASWIIKSLHSGKLLPFPSKGHSAFPAIKIQEIPVSTKLSEDS